MLRNIYFLYPVAQRNATQRNLTQLNATQRILLV